MHVFIIAASPHTHTGSSVFFPCSCPSVSVPSRKRFLHKWPRNHPIRHERPSLFFPYNNLPVGSLLTGITFLHARFQPYLLAPPPHQSAYYTRSYCQGARVFFEDIWINMIYSFLWDVIQQTKRYILLRPSLCLI